MIVYPCSYTADHEELSWLIGPDGVLDPTRWFIVIPDMFSNGLSSSAADTADYPALVTMADNVRAQHRLLTEHFGVTRVAAAYGFSMGAGQAYHWAALYPDLVERAIVVCGSARTSIHNKVFLSGLLRTLEAAPEYQGNGHVQRRTGRRDPRLRPHLRGLGPEPGLLPRAALRDRTGAPDLATSCARLGGAFAEHRAANLYAQALTWQQADISANDFTAATCRGRSRRSSAKVLLMPSTTDLYFRVADNEAELPHLRSAIAPIPSIWGTARAAPGIPADLEFLTSHVRAWLDA